MGRFVIAGATVVVLLLANAAGAVASGWSNQRTPNPARRSMSELDGVSCVSARACTAVGTSSNGASTHLTLAERWNGTRWSIKRTPNPPDSSLSGVSCVSTSACTAVGYDVNGGAGLTLAERWNGTRWSIERTPNPTGSTTSILRNVSCGSASACTAVGYYISGASDIKLSLAERWNGRTWSIERPPAPTGGLSSELYGVSCPSARACTAVGDYTRNGTTYVTLAERWNGSRWSIERTRSASSEEDSFLYGVSCVSARACTAVGAISNRATDVRVTLAERWNGTRWSIQATPGRSGNFLNSVSCVSASACTAVGSSSTRGFTSTTLAERLNGSRWLIQRTRNPPGSSTFLDGVSCASARACSAVGGRATATLAERWRRRR